MRFFFYLDGFPKGRLSPFKSIYVYYEYPCNMYSCLESISQKAKLITFEDEDTAKQLIREEVEVGGIKLKIKEAVSTSQKRTSHAGKNQMRRNKDTKRARKFF